ncbi:MAG: lipopolysaccharide biosynthesis protein, partial [Burkholderiaceae bacterium]|nr:lipopolysaccharide biosynthesis protein [Microbacteriaceae bacterium]
MVVVLWTAPADAVQIMLALLLTEDRLRPFAVVSGISAVGGQVVGIALLLGVHNDATTYAWG